MLRVEINDAHATPCMKECGYMNISGIRPEAGFYDFNSIRNKELITPEEIDEAVKAPEKVKTGFSQEAATVELSDVGMARARAAQTFGAYDFASMYRPGETFEMKGEESNINSLDVQKAVSDIKKDEILNQYQYFVGDRAPSQLGPDSIPENFSL